MRRKRRHAPDQIGSEITAEHLEISAAVEMEHKQFLCLPGEGTGQAADFLCRVVDREAALAPLIEQRPKPARCAVAREDRESFVNRNRERAAVLEQEPGELFKLTGQVLKGPGEVRAVDHAERPTLGEAGNVREGDLFAPVFIFNIPVNNAVLPCGQRL